MHVVSKRGTKRHPSKPQICVQVGPTTWFNEQYSDFCGRDYPVQRQDSTFAVYRVTSYSM